MVQLQLQHMYIIDPKGDLFLMGVMEDNPSSRRSSVEGAKNYVRGVQAVTRPSGCAAKYAY
tara:strand:+ start:456 stop:638 length:183 start_codon:yes stop_codon:yes gene_type:complete